jgi:DNA-binding CsgD family transcriptional regulator
MDMRASSAAQESSNSTMAARSADNRRHKQRRAVDHSPELLAQIAVGLAEFDNRPIIVTDAKSDVLLANSAARQVLAATNILSITSSRLSFGDTRCARQFKHYLAGSSDSLRMTVHDGRNTLQLTARRILNNGADATAILVFIALPLSMRRQALQSTLGLTRAEAEIAIAIFEGRSLVRISRDRETSINTVKTQMRFVFQKCRARSRAALVRRLSEVVGAR